MPTVEIISLILILLLCGLATAILLKIGQAKIDPKVIKDESDRLLGHVRAEFGTNRQESSQSARSLRQEITGAVQELGKMLHGQVTTLGSMQQQQFKEFSDRLDALRTTLTQAAQDQRREQAESLKNFNDSTLKSVSVMSTQQKEQLEILRTQVGELTRVNEAKLHEMAMSNTAKLTELGENINTKMDTLRALLDTKLEVVRQVVVDQLEKVRQENTVKLEEMRRTVDEKLHDTLEKRLGESFKQVSERLELVHKGLGEMQSLATGVGDLKKVLTNIKVRGIWGEIQLGNLLEQILTPEQYIRHARPKPHSNEEVEFAIRLPGREEGDTPVLLPIDAKFPKEDYERLVDASERADARGVEDAAKQLEARIKQAARDIRDKYISPPHTTDFALLYLPIEGLYAEVLRRPGLVETLQRDYRVSVAGPTTLAALLNSLQMGFRSLAIQKRSSEVWMILAAVKKKFESFGAIFEKAQKKIQEADRALEEAKADTRIMGKKLKRVESISEAEAARVLELPTAGGDIDYDDDDTMTGDS